MKTIKRRRLNKKPVFLCCKKIRIYPTFDQKQILNEWFDAFSQMFNITIHHLRILDKVNCNTTSKKLKKLKKIVTFEKIRKILYNKKHQIQSFMMHKIPIHTLDEAIHQAVSNYRTCLSNIENGHIKKFRIREWSSNRRRKIIKLESICFKKGTFCPATFPDIKSSFDLNNISRAVTLQYNSDSKKYILLVPVSIKSKKIYKKRSACGIDLGVRSFITAYSSNGVKTFCNNAYKDSRIKNYHKKIDKLHELINLSNDVDNKTQFVQFNKKICDTMITDLKVKDLNKQN